MEEAAQKCFNQINRYISNHPGIGEDTVNFITSHIYIGSYASSLDASHLRKIRVNTVINASSQMKSKKSLSDYRKQKINHINAIPNEGMFEEIYTIIQKLLVEGKVVFIHDISGKNEAAALVCYFILKRLYLMAYDRATKSKNFKRLIRNLVSPKEFKLPKIVEFLKESRPCIEISPELVGHLIHREIQFKVEYHHRAQALLESLTTGDENIVISEELFNSSDDDESLDETMIDVKSTILRYKNSLKK